MRDLILAFLGFISLWGFEGVLQFKVPCVRFLHKFLVSVRYLISAFLGFFSLWGFVGFCSSGCYVVEEQPICEVHFSTSCQNEFDQQ